MFNSLNQSPCDMSVALAEVCDSGKFYCSKYLALTNTIMFFRIFITPTFTGNSLPCPYSKLIQVMSMQHCDLLLSVCMRLLPEWALPQVTLHLFCWMPNFNFLFPPLLAGWCTLLIVSPPTANSELQLLCPFNLSLMSPKIGRASCRERVFNWV